MEFWTVTLISLAAGLVLVIGGALVVHMGALVKSAYQLKIEIKAEMDDGQKKIHEDVDKKLRWIKRDLIEEIDKIKAGLQADHQRRVAETTAAVEQRLGAAAEEWRNDRIETLKILDGLRHDVLVLDQRQRGLRREQSAKAEVLQAPPPNPAQTRPSTGERTAPAQTGEELPPSAAEPLMPPAEPQSAAPDPVPTSI